MEKGGDVKKANLLLTIPNTHSKIVVRAGEGALDVYISNRKDPKEIGPLWKVGDTNLCGKRLKIIRHQEI